MIHPLKARHEAAQSAALEADRKLREAQRRGDATAITACQTALDAAIAPANLASDRWRQYLARADGTNEATLAAELGYSLADLEAAERELANMLAGG